MFITILLFLGFLLYFSLGLKQTMVVESGMVVLYYIPTAYSKLKHFICNFKNYLS